MAPNRWRCLKFPCSVSPKNATLKQVSNTLRKRGNFDQVEHSEFTPDVSVFMKIPMVVMLVLPTLSWFKKPQNWCPQGAWSGRDEGIPRGRGMGWGPGSLVDRSTRGVSRHYPNLAILGVDGGWIRVEILRPTNSLDLSSVKGWYLGFATLFEAIFGTWWWLQVT